VTRSGLRRVQALGRGGPGGLEELAAVTRPIVCTGCRTVDLVEWAVGGASLGGPPWFTSMLCCER